LYLLLLVEAHHHLCISFCCNSFSPTIIFVSSFANYGSSFQVQFFVSNYTSLRPTIIYVSPSAATPWGPPSFHYLLLPIMVVFSRFCSLFQIILGMIFNSTFMLQSFQLNFIALIRYLLCLHKKPKNWKNLWCCSDNTSKMCCNTLYSACYLWG